MMLTATKFWPRGKHYLTLLREAFPLSLQGVITTVLALLALNLFGFATMDLVVFALCICTLAIIGFSLASVLIGGYLLRSSVQQQITLNEKSSRSLKLEAGFPNDSSFEILQPRFLPLVKISWQIVQPDYIHTSLVASADDSKIGEQLIPLKRCYSPSIVRRFTVSDVLGFCRFSWRAVQNKPLMVLPQVNTLRTLPLLHSLTSEDGIANPDGSPEGDRMEIRPYVPGDSVRNILWKSYARNRQLNVRLAEKSVFHSRRTVAYLLSSTADEAAAAVARTALETDALGEDYSFGADGSNTVSDSLQPSLEAIAKSRSLNSATPLPYGLDEFLEQSNAAASAHCIVFASANLAHGLASGLGSANKLSALKQTISRHRGQFSVILATDGFTTSNSTKLWQRLLFKTASRQENTHADGLNGQSVSRLELAAVLTELGQLVESIMVIDRKTGFSFDKKLNKL